MERRLHESLEVDMREREKVFFICTNRENSNYKFHFFWKRKKFDRQTDGPNNVWLDISRVLLRNNGEIDS